MRRRMLPPERVLSTPLRALEFRNLYWVLPSDSLAAVADVMAHRRARHLPVGSKGIASAIISMRDVAKAMLERGESWRSVSVEEAATSPPLALDEGASVADAVGLMSKMYTGSVLVTNNGLAEDMVTEEGLVRLMVGMSFRRRVHEIMTLDPRVVEPTATARDALAEMISGNFRHLPVVSNGAVMGMVSMRDLVSTIAGGRLGLGDPLLPAMTADPLSVDPSASSEDAARLMSSRDVGSLLVLDAARLVGIVTGRDLVLRVMAKLIG